MSEHIDHSQGDALTQDQVAKVLGAPYAIDGLRRKPKTEAGKSLGKVLEVLIESGVPETDAIKIVTDQEPREATLDSYRVQQDQPPID